MGTKMPRTGGPKRGGAGAAETWAPGAPGWTCPQRQQLCLTIASPTLPTSSSPGPPRRSSGAASTRASGARSLSCRRHGRRTIAKQGCSPPGLHASGIIAAGREAFSVMRQQRRLRPPPQRVPKSLRESTIAEMVIRSRKRAGLMGRSGGAASTPAWAAGARGTRLRTRTPRTTAATAARTGSARGPTGRSGGAARGTWTTAARAGATRRPRPPLCRTTASRITPATGPRGSRPGAVRKSFWDAQAAPCPASCTAYRPRAGTESSGQRTTCSSTSTMPAGTPTASSGRSALAAPSAPWTPPAQPARPRRSRTTARRTSLAGPLQGGRGAATITTRDARRTRPAL
mmetsp:Transcript_47392/g.133752  ORF Transcript_47392/g.133752 Transcript_47392/m.133752 type:complete len:344 (+) Transcript_47392:291-1322(+)